MTTANSNPRVMMGIVTPGDQKVALPVRDWNALKLALWRSAGGWAIIRSSCIDIVARCRHANDCPGTDSNDDPCLPDCPDREIRMSALVALAAASMFAPLNARRPADEPYFAPSREHYSELWAALAAQQAELDALHESGVQTPPPSNEGAPGLLPSQLAQFKEAP